MSPEPGMRGAANTPEPGMAAASQGTEADGGQGPGPPLGDCLLRASARDFGTSNGQGPGLRGPTLFLCPFPLFPDPGV